MVPFPKPHETSWGVVAKRGPSWSREHGLWPRMLALPEAQNHPWHPLPGPGNPNSYPARPTLLRLCPKGWEAHSEFLSGARETIWTEHAGLEPAGHFLWLGLLRAPARLPTTCFLPRLLGGPESDCRQTGAGLPRRVRDAHPGQSLSVCEACPHHRAVRLSTHPAGPGPGDRAHTDSCVPAPPPSASQLTPMPAHAPPRTHCVPGPRSQPGCRAPGDAAGRPCVGVGGVYVGAPTPEPASSVKGTPRIIPASKGRPEDAFLKPGRPASPLYTFAGGPPSWKRTVRAADGCVPEAGGTREGRGWAGSTDRAPEPHGPVRASQAQRPSWGSSDDPDQEQRGGGDAVPTGPPWPAAGTVEMTSGKSLALWGPLPPSLPQEYR